MLSDHHRFVRRMPMERCSTNSDSQTEFDDSHYLKKTQLHEDARDPEPSKSIVEHTEEARYWGDEATQSDEDGKLLR